jgi:transposase
MPWKTVSLLKVRQRLVEAVLVRRQTVRVICHRAGISRKTAYKWLTRFRRQGLPGLRDQSRLPRRSPTRLSAYWIQAIGQWRQRRRHWGAKKIYRQLCQKYPRHHVPCVCTIQRWLKRLGWVRPKPRRARRGPALPHPGLTVPTRANQVWTVDFKGWFRTADGVRQEPLTVRDLFSRYGLCLRLLPNQDDRPVRRVMRELFRQRGLPEGGQRFAFRRHGRVGSVAPVGVVDAAGYSRRVLPAGGVRATMLGTNNFMAVINSRWWLREQPIAARCNSVPRAGWPITTRSVRTKRWGSGCLPKCTGPAGVLVLISRCWHP